MKFIMNFLRSPFQFRSTDQPNRKAESDSPVVENMFIDPTTGLTEDPKWRGISPGVGTSSSAAGSPRLQHRVPGLENNGNHPVEVVRDPFASQGASSEDCEKPQRVHIVPIKVESVDDSNIPKKRSSAFPSNSGTIPRSGQFSPSHRSFEDLANRKRHFSGPPVHKKCDVNESKPKVCNIPIFVESRDTPVVPKTSQSSHNVPAGKTPSPNAQPVVTHNGGSSSKCSAKSKYNQDGKQKVFELSLKQISDVLNELQPLKLAVDEFKGVPQDKQYRYLDEMLTRCMLKLDNVETHGNDEVRASRKAAVKAVQECINDLEARGQANAKLDQSTEKMDETEEKCSSPNDTGTGKVENDTHEIIQDKSEAITETANLSVTDEQFGMRETADSQLKPLSLEKTDPSANKSELMAGSVESTEMAPTKDENSNLQGAMSKPMEVEEIKAATNDVEKQENLQVQDQPCAVGTPEQAGSDPVDSAMMAEDIANKTMGTSVEQVGDVKDPVDSIELSDVPSSFVSPGDSSKQSEPISSEVPEETMLDVEMVEAKDEPVDCEMAELPKEPVASESNKDTPVSS